MPRRPPCTEARPRGFALLGVLWALALLALLLLPVIRLSAESVLSARAAQRQMQLRWQAEAGIALALHEILGSIRISGVEQTDGGIGGNFTR